MEKLTLLFSIDNDNYAITLEERGSYKIERPYYNALVSLDLICENPTKNKTGRGFVKISFLNKNGDVYKTMQSICTICKLRNLN